MKLPIYAVLVGRVSFLQTLIVVLLCFFLFFLVDGVLFYVVLFLVFDLKKHAHSADLKKRTFIKIKKEKMWKILRSAFSVKICCAFMTVEHIISSTIIAHS